MTVTSIAPALLRMSAVDGDTAALIDKLSNLISAYRLRNDLKQMFYDGQYIIRDLGISVPPELRNLGVVVGWPGTCVDVIEERLDLLGWDQLDGANLDLATIFNDNALDTDSSLAHIDALVYGTAFVTVGRGDDGEPSPLITVESPQDMTGIYDQRTHRLTSAMLIDEYDESGKPTKITLYQPDRTTWLEQTSTGWTTAGIDQHDLGRVPVAQIVNRPRASRRGGRSEITRAVQHYTMAAGRTLLGMEVNREFYQAPQRYVLGAAEGSFQRADGSAVDGWQTIMGRVLGLERDENGELPQVGQFDQSQPAPYLDQVKGIALLLAAECGIPSSYLGFYTENPSSADAIRAGESRLVKRAERRQTNFGHAWLEVARLALLVRDGSVPDNFASLIVNNWRDAATPTRAAAADEATKLVGSQILPSNSRVTYARVGLTPHEIAQVEIDKAANPSDTALLAQAISNQAPPQVQAPQQVPPVPA